MMTYGVWGSPQFCPAGMFAIDYQMKIEGSQGDGDGTALNAIELTCAKLDGTVPGETITSSVGLWVSWGGTVRCPTIHGSNFFLTEFALQVEADQHGGDDTAANNIKFKFRDFQGSPNKQRASTDARTWDVSCHGKLE